jgi:hypothetical protein
LLGLLRQAQEQRCTNYEVLLIKAYLERLKGTILSLESLEILTQVHSDRADRADSKSKV